MLAQHVVVVKTRSAIRTHLDGSDDDAQVLLDPNLPALDYDCDLQLFDQSEGKLGRVGRYSPIELNDLDHYFDLMSRARMNAPIL